MARAVGRCGNAARRLLAKRSTSLTLEPCHDWEKLSTLSRQHGSADLITARRSPEYLEWRYSATSPNHPVDIHLFRDRRGNEGWFALGRISRGREGQIRGRVLLDVSWPRAKMDFSEIFPSVARLAAAGADTLVFQSRPGVDYRTCGLGIFTRRFSAPRVFAVTPRGGRPVVFSSLDLVPADGDSAFRISVGAGSS
jgi:hypothetical protein